MLGPVVALCGDKPIRVCKVHDCVPQPRASGLSWLLPVRRPPPSRARFPSRHMSMLTVEKIFSRRRTRRRSCRCRGRCLAVTWMVCVVVFVMIPPWGGRRGGWSIPTRVLMLMPVRVEYGTCVIPNLFFCLVLYDLCMGDKTPIVVLSQLHMLASPIKTGRTSGEIQHVHCMYPPGKHGARP